MVGTFLGRMSVKWDQATCRHNYHWAFREKHTFLRCTKCKHETAGWDLRDVKPPTRRFEGDGSGGVKSRSK
jgi:hypothetical protein